MTRRQFITSVLAAISIGAGACGADRLAQIGITSDGRGFVLNGSPFVPWGFNYDHDENDRLLEDYWEKEWPKVEEDFREMGQLGANVVRIHLQFGRFMMSPTKANPRNLQQLRRLVDLAEKVKLYLDITGLGCYHKSDVPGWYDALSEQDRWKAQAAFWRAIANVCRDSPAIFCYDLMNEPVVPPATGRREDWLGTPFAGKHFVQWIALETKGRERRDIARKWIHELAGAIREIDRKHLITVGLVPWSLDRPGLYSGFAPAEIAPELDFMSVHLYPEKGKVNEGIDTLKGFAVGKPLLIEETFPLSCPMEDFVAFIERSRGIASGWVGFYWGRTLEESRQSKSLRDHLVVDWLEYFRSHNPTNQNRPKLNTK